MSDYKQYVHEKTEIDKLIQMGYRIIEVKENLSGAFVKFEAANREAKQLHICTADARKYFSSLIIVQKLG